MNTKSAPADAVGELPPLPQAREDALQLRYFAASLTYNDTTAEGEAKHRLYEIAMRIETGYYAKRAFEAGWHAGAGLERAALSQAPRPEGPAVPLPIDAYYVPTDKPLGFEIKVQRSRQLDGRELWSVRNSTGECLNKQGTWEWEPRPSERDDEFLTRCRFDSPRQAVAALQSIPANGTGDDA